MEISEWKLVSLCYRRTTLLVTNQPIHLAFLLYNAKGIVGDLCSFVRSVHQFEGGTQWKVSAESLTVCISLS
jgi:hypothetical protein